jgi:hypothetical protein
MHDVISAFLDNEPFDARELKDALAMQEGRDLLVDLIALREIVQPTGQQVVVQTGRPLWMLASAAAAAVLLALFSGYQFGRNEEAIEPLTPGESITVTTAAPEPTTVLKFEPGVNWSETPRDGGS